MKKIVVFVFAILFLKAEAQSSASAIADSLYSVGSYTAAINAYATVGSEKASLQIARGYTAIGDKEKAILQYQNIIKKNKANVLAKFELGKLLDKSKKYKEAIVLFKDLTNPESKNPAFYYYLGKSLLSEITYDPAVTALKKSIALDSSHIKSIYLLGKYYLSVQEPLNAKEVIDLGLQTAPNDPALINLKALYFYDRGDYEESAPLFERLLELGEKKPFVYKKLGYSYSSRWEYKKAKEVYRNLEDIMGQEADAYLGLAQVFFKEKELDSAEVYYKKAIVERRYIFDKEYSSLGRIARLRGNLKKALEYYTKAWEEDKVNQFNYWQVCVMADEYYKDPKVKLSHYKKLVSDFDNLQPFLRERAVNRIKELKEEIHFNAE